jgi:hypothetical protein
VYAIPKLIWRILSFASAEGLCKAPEWDFVMGRPEKMNPTVILTQEQERRLLDYLTENPTPKNLGIYLILTAGISVGEVLALTWADVSFTLKRIRVLMEKEYAPETRKKFRDVPINERQRIYLTKLASLPTVYVANGKPKPVLRSTLRISFLNALKEVGLPEMTLSDLRRTCAVRCLEGGMSYDRLGKVLGDDRDGKMLVEYLRCNMRVAAMPSQKDVCVQTIRTRIARGFAKLTDRLDAIYEVEGFNILDMFHELTNTKIQKIAPPVPKKSGPNPKPTLENVQTTLRKKVQSMFAYYRR